MTIDHRKLLPNEQPYSNQPSNSSDCNPAVPNNCDYTSFYWPPEPPQLPPTTTTYNNYHVSPYLIIVVTLIASVVLFISYYLIIIRYCARLRQVNEQSRNFINEDHQPDVDHPIWYINTIGLQPSVINSITVFTFRKDDSLIESKGCSVCLSDFENNENLRLLHKCNHAFHIICIDTWLRSHTTCPLCRAAVVSNDSNESLQANDQRRNIGVGLNQNTQMENQESDSELDLNHVHESEVQELKTEVVETVVKLRRSFSMDSAANTIVTDLSLGNSTNELQRLNNMRNSRTRTRMMMMVRSLSYSTS